MIRVVEDGTIFCITSSCLALVAVLFCTVPRKISTQSFFFSCVCTYHLHVLEEAQLLRSS